LPERISADVSGAFPHVTALRERRRTTPNRSVRGIFAGWNAQRRCVCESERHGNLERVGPHEDKTVAMGDPTADALGRDAVAALRRWGTLVGVRRDVKTAFEPLAGRDYRNGDLSSADLTSCLLKNYDFRGAKFHLATLDETHWLWTDLHGTDFTSASLRRARFSGCDLRGVDLSWADLTRAYFSTAQGPAGFVGCDLTGARLDGIRFRYGRYDKATVWPDGFDPAACGAELVC
jgi:Pentapeptide repeats (8 copies)